MRRLSTMALFLALAGCALLTRAPAIEGAWRSSRELTLADIREARTFAPSQLETLADPEKFGHWVQVYRGGEMITVAWGKCSARQSYRIVDSDARSATVRYRDEAWGAEKTVHFDLDEQRLYVPFAIATPDLREVFTRVPLEEVTENADCVRSFVGE
jgi:hypothetical protein